jgi:hypothetical protein
MELCTDQIVTGARSVRPKEGHRPRGRTVLFQPRSGAMSILIGILITFLVVILVLYLINMLPLDARAKQIAQAVVIIIGIISLLKYLAVF